MKLLVFFVSLFNILTLSNSYLTKEQEFNKYIDESYEIYVYNDLSSAAGDLIVTVGEINGKVSFSVYFKNISYPKYQVKIIEEKVSSKEYILSNYDDYQIYYNISVNNNTKYYIELINKESETTYNRYYVVGSNSLNEFDSTTIINGKGLDNFPFETKLKQKLSLFQIIGIIVGVVIIVEILVSMLVYFSRKKKRKQLANAVYRPSNNEVIYDNVDYIVKDNDDEN